MRIGFCAAAGAATAARASSASKCRFQFMVPPLENTLFFTIQKMLLYCGKSLRRAAAGCQCLVELDVGFLRHAAPLRDLALDEGGELRGRGGCDIESGGGKALPELRLRERPVERVRELRHRLRRGAGGREHALEAACIHPGQTGL